MLKTKKEKKKIATQRKKGERETQRKERQRNSEAKNEEGERDWEIEKLQALKTKTQNTQSSILSIC